MIGIAKTVFVVAVAASSMVSAAPKPMPLPLPIAPIRMPSVANTAPSRSDRSSRHVDKNAVVNNRQRKHHAPLPYHIHTKTDTPTQSFITMGSVGESTLRVMKPAPTATLITFGMEPATKLVGSGLLETVVPTSGPSSTNQNMIQMVWA